MNAYVFLGGAIALEVAATTAMKSSDGFTKLDLAPELSSS